MKTVKVLDIHDGIHITCTYTEQEVNPYRLYLEYRTIGKHPYPTKHKKLIAKYGDMGSVMCMLQYLYVHGIHHRPISNVLTWCKAYYGS